MTTLWRRVFHRYWWNLGWHSKFRGVQRWSVTWSLTPSSMNLPRLDWDIHLADGFVSLSWANGGSDPVWSIGVQWDRERPVPERVTGGRAHRHRTTATARGRGLDR